MHERFRVLQKTIAYLHRCPAFCLPISCGPVEDTVGMPMGSGRSSDKLSMQSAVSTRKVRETAMCVGTDQERIIAVSLLASLHRYLRPLHRCKDEVRGRCSRVRERVLSYWFGPVLFGSTRLMCLLHVHFPPSRRPPSTLTVHCPRLSTGPSPRTTTHAFHPSFSHTPSLAVHRTPFPTSAHPHVPRDGSPGMHLRYPIVVNLRLRLRNRSPRSTPNLDPDIDVATPPSPSQPKSKALARI